MTGTGELLRLMSWLSPVFPTGGFAYSAGLEQAAATGIVTDTETLRRWIAAILASGPQWNDAVLLAAAWRGALDGEALAALTELACAMTGSAERRRETLDQGTGFLEAAENWFDTGELPPRGAPLPVAVGAACGLRAIPLESGLAAYLHAFTANQLQVAIRLSVTGQRGAAALLARLEPVVAETAGRAAASTLDDLGSNTILADIAAMQHETLRSRLFLS